MLRRITLALLLSATAHAAPLALYVSPQGDDAWSGTRPERGADAAGPFATLERARDELRHRRAAGTLAEGAVVNVLDGLYELPRPLVLEPQDSGAPGAPVVWAAAEGARPVLSAGRRLTGWRAAEGQWTLTLPEVREGWRFSHLFVNGQRRFRPRLPAPGSDPGYQFIAGAVPPATGDRPDGFRFRRGDLRADWANLEDVEVHVFHVWSTARLPVVAVDERERRVTLAGPTWHAGLFPLGPPRPYGGRYLVENVKEALVVPGEWYLDRPTGVLTYLPLPGEDPARTVVVAPRLERVLELRGDVAARQWVHDVQFRGLTFTHGNWTVPPKGHSLPQAEFQVGALVNAVGARDCVFEQCRVTRTDGYGLELGQGCHRNTVADCEFADLGAGGIKIGPGGGDDEAVATGNVVRDCLIAHGGRMHPAAVGVWVGYARDTLIEHNDIVDFYYSGISSGWSWGYGETPNRDNVIEGNHIRDLPQRVLGDMGGIYTLGRQPGSVIRGNRIHGQDGVPWGVGIYLDEGSSGFTVERNLVCDASTHAFHVNYGRENVVRNNVFAFGRVITLGRGRAEDHASDVIERNVIVWREGNLLGQWAKAGRFDRNLYWRYGDGPVEFGGGTFEAWQAQGQDVDSLVADPKFSDPERGDFRLADDSPARALGFEPFDVSGAGRRTGPGRDERPWPAVFPPAPTEVPPTPVEQDYEHLAVGDKDDQAASYEDSDAATARVTAETAAGGARSLKFTDAAGQKNFWNPHIHYSPHYHRGVVTVAFDVRVEAGGQLEHAWRDDAQPFRTGPSMQFGPEGRLTAAGRELLRLPLGQWVHVEVTCALGDAADGTWDLTVTLPGTEPRRFADLPCTPDYRQLCWLGFVSVANEAGAAYLDEVRAGVR